MCIPAYASNVYRVLRCAECSSLGEYRREEKSGVDLNGPARRRVLKIYKCGARALLLLLTRNFYLSFFRTV
jgi:hypothetical protein